MCLRIIYCPQNITHLHIHSISTTILCEQSKDVQSKVYFSTSQILVSHRLYTLPSCSYSKPVNTHRLLKSLYSHVSTHVDSLRFQPLIDFTYDARFSRNLDSWSLTRLKATYTIILGNLLNLAAKMAAISLSVYSRKVQVQCVTAYSAVTNTQPRSQCKDCDEGQVLYNALQTGQATYPEREVWGWKIYSNEDHNIISKVLIPCADDIVPDWMK